jgi:hypothetical protein
MAVSFPHSKEGKQATFQKACFPITLHGHRRPRLYRGAILAPVWIS